jgi:two-component system, LytTR family, response regulator LytT
MTRVLVIEDEIKTARLIKSFVEADDAFTVTAIVPSIKGGVEWLAANTADLIFSDIQLADGLSFEIFRQVKVQVPVIFCTAFDEYAINAFEANGIDYLLKPVEEEKLQQSLDKFKAMRNLFAPQQNYNRLENTIQKLGGYKTSLLVHHRERIIPLKTEHIDFINSENGIVTLYIKGGMRYHVNYTLDELEAMLNPEMFFKINRQFIINRNAIEAAEHYFSRRLLVRMSVKTPGDIIVSKARTQAFLKWMDN